MAGLTIEPPTYEAVRYILANARERDRFEVTAVVGAYDPVLLSDEIVKAWAERGAFGAVYGNGYPCAVLTALRETPTSVQVGLIATDAFPKLAVSVTRHVKRYVEPMLRGLGVKRAECRCWSEHVDARRWLSICGAREECEVPGYGANGETFIQMAWQ